MLQCKTKWTSKTIENCCDILDSKRIPINEEERDSLKGNIPYYGANGLQGYINDYIFDDDLILLAEDGGYFDEYETRPIAYKISGKSWVNNHAHILKPKNSYNFNYVFYNLEHKNILYYINGGTRAKLTQEELKKIRINIIDDYDMQSKIADILSTCDEVIEKTEETIEKYKQIKAGMMQDLFTRGLDENGKLRPTYAQNPDLYKYSKLLDRYIPTEWEADKLDNLFTYTVGGDVDKPCFSEYKTSLHKYPIFANAVDNEGLYGYSSKFVIDSPAITIAGRGVNVGTVFYRDAFFTPIVRLVVVFPNECLNILFASIALSRIKFESEATGIPQLTVPMVKKYKMAYPKNKEEQQNIYKYLHKIDLKLEKEEQYLNKYKQIKQGLMKRLLTPPADAEIVEE